MQKHITVKSVQSAMVQDIASMHAGVKRFIGWKLDKSLGDAGGWVRTEEPVTTQHFTEYDREIQLGNLVVANIGK